MLVSRVNPESLPAALKIAIAVLAPVALACAFPKTNWWLFAFVAAAPMFWLWSRAPLLSAFWWGWLSGAVYFGITMDWVPNSLGDYIGAWKLLALVLMAAWQGFSFAAVAVMVSLVCRRGYGAAAVFAAPAAWLLVDFVRTRGSMGVPFGSLGFVGAHLSWLLPLAAYAGVYGLTAIFALANSAVTGLVWGTDAARRVSAAVLGVLVLLVALGDAQRSHVVLPAPRLRVGIAQGNISQRVKWSPEIFAHTLELYTSLTRKAAAGGARVVVWPETVVTAYPLQEPWLLHDLQQDAASAHVYILTGTLDKLTPRGYHNAVLDLTPAGRLAGVYDKHILVPFAEYLPFDRALRHLPLMDQASDFFPGPGPHMLTAGGMSAGLLVCYESGFASYTRATANAGASTLVIVTDDAWWGDTAGPYQHFDMGVIDAVQTGRWVVRAAATGISGIIDPNGRVVAQLPLDVAGSIVAPIGAPVETPYDRYGALWLIVLAAVALVVGLLPARVQAMGWRSARGPA
jgi:apolipoprotein N-acyltransferase